MQQMPAQNPGQVLPRKRRARSVRARNKEIRLPQRDLQPEAGPDVPRMRHMEEWLRQKRDRLVHQRQGIGLSLSYVRLWLEEDSLQEKQAPLPVSQPKARGLNPDLKFVADIPVVHTRPRLRLEQLASAVRSSRGVSLATHAPRLCRAESCGHSTKCSTLPRKVHLLYIFCSH